MLTTCVPVIPVWVARAKSGLNLNLVRQVPINPVVPRRDREGQPRMGNTSERDQRSLVPLGRVVHPLLVFTCTEDGANPFKVHEACPGTERVNEHSVNRYKTPQGLSTVEHAYNGHVGTKECDVLSV